MRSYQALSLTPPELAGHALGLHSAGMLTLQGVSAALAGGVAQLTSPGAAMTLLAGASVAVTLALWRPARRSRPAPTRADRAGAGREPTAPS
uniref:hypothetical protein n=1 Tax=Streptomyces sp. TG1A-60 TaxID=3129111 RepID=UPI00404031DA